MKSKFSEEFGLNYNDCLRSHNTVYRGQVKRWAQTSLDMLGMCMPSQFSQHTQSQALGSMMSRNDEESVENQEERPVTPSEDSEARSDSESEDSKGGAIKHGYGEMYWLDGGTQYQGMWRNNMLDGKGILMTSTYMFEG